jgi:hypothetical protein
MKSLKKFILKKKITGCLRQHVDPFKRLPKGGETRKRSGMKDINAYYLCIATTNYYCLWGSTW